MSTSSDAAPARQVGILVYDGVTMIDVAGPADVFHHANLFGASYAPLLVSGDGGPAIASNGLTLHADRSVPEITDLDTIIVPGAYGMITRPLDPALLRAVQELSERSRRVASVCTGAFVLAAIGLLDHRRATTHWTHVDRLARLHPSIDVQRDALFVRDGRVVTSAGVTSGIDLSLALVEDDHGPEVAQRVARQMIVFMQRPGHQSQFSVPGRSHVPADNPLRVLLDAIGSDPAADYSLPTMAALAHVSTRTLTRLFRELVGTTPARYVERVRIESAQALLRNGATVATAATLSGFGSAETMRRVFVNRLGMSPSSYATTPVARLQGGPSSAHLGGHENRPRGLRGLSVVSEGGLEPPRPNTGTSTSS